MTTNIIIDLPEDYALVLQQVKENGEDDFANLAETLHVSRSRMAHIIQALQSKGLVHLSRSLYSEAWIRLSHKGQKLTSYLWPEAIGQA